MDLAGLRSLTSNYQYGIMSLPFCIDFVRENFPHLQIKSISPYSFTIGSQNNEENISYNHQQSNSLFFGKLYLNINPNENELEPEVIKITFRSYFNTIPYEKHINRIVERENLINEQTYSEELFDNISLIQTSKKYDLYLTFVGFKIDYA